MSKGHLSTHYTVPTGGYAMALNVSGAVTATVPAGTYAGIVALMAAVKSALDTAATATFTVTINTTETVRTNLVTIDLTSGGGNWTLNWTDTELRDALGFAGNLSGANAYTGTLPVPGMWTPDCPVAAYYGNTDPGHTVAMMSQTRSGTGRVYTVVESEYVEHPEILWSHVSAPYARETRESTTNSFERWRRDTQLGALEIHPAGSTVRWTPDSDTVATNYDYSLVWDGTTRMERVDPAWDYLWRITVTGIQQ
jgi:hypothetical protein